MYPPFPQEEAYEECKKIISLLDDGFMTLELITQESESRFGSGIMIGSLVCKTVCGERIVLKTVSGISRALKLSPYLSDENSVYVEPIVSVEKINEALSENDKEIHSLTDEIAVLKAQYKDVSALSKRRLYLCDVSLKKVHNLYSFHCIDGSMKSLNSIFLSFGKKAPTGIGDCCAPKLLDYAFSHNLTPVSMAEVFYGKDSEKKKNGELYPPCDERCGFLLPKMLGLKIIYQDSSLVVVEKPSGLLSVPGRTTDKQDCVVSRVKRLYPFAIKQPAVHRLDMETSGLMVLAFTKEAHKELSRQFEAGEVQKQYEAVLDGNMIKKGIAKKGRMELYFRLDIDNRPHQIWDSVYGKKAVTEWEFVRIEKYHFGDEKARDVSRVLFTPHTGRTHQLRLASADKHGFGIAIVGDTLYGECKEGERLLLHARFLSFTHPVTKERMSFVSECPF